MKKIFILFTIIASSFFVIYNNTLNVDASSITNLTGTKWLLNEKITHDPIDGFTLYDDGLLVSTAYLNFKLGDDNNYDEMRFFDTFFGSDSLYYETGGFDVRNAISGNYLQIYYITSLEDYYFEDPKYRIIEITGGTDATNTDLINWFTTNATPYVEPVGYTVTFNSNGGSSVTSLSDVEELPTLTVPSKPGYLFLGWYYESNFITKAKSNDVLTADITLYARWVLDSVNNLTFQANNYETINFILNDTELKFSDTTISFQRENNTINLLYIAPVDVVLNLINYTSLGYQESIYINEKDVVEIKRVFGAINESTLIPLLTESTIKVNGDLVYTDASYGSGSNKKPALINVIEKELHDLIDTTEDYYTNYGVMLDSNNNTVDYIDFRIYAEDLVWTSNKVIEIEIPIGYKALINYPQLPGEGYIRRKAETYPIELRAYSNTGLNYWDLYINNTLIERKAANPSTGLKYFGFNLIPEDYTYVQVIDSMTDSSVTYYLAKIGENFFDLKINSLSDNLEYYQKNVFYYDHELTEVVSDTDLVVDNLLVYKNIELNTDLLIISFDTDGGSTIADFVVSKSQYGIEASGFYAQYTLEQIEFEYPTNPSKSGYLFVGWQIVGIGRNYNFEFTKFEGDLTFKAIWVQVGTELEVKFIGGYGNQTVTINIEAGDTIDSNLIPVFSRLGYRFMGFDFDFETPILENTDIYPIYQEVTAINVTFNVNGGVYQAPITIPFTLGSALIKENLPNPTKANAIFTGWFIDSNLTIPVKDKIYLNNQDDMIYYDITLYANWYDNGALIRFETNTSALNISPVIITKGNAVNISIPPRRTGYIFAGWFLDEELTMLYEGEAINEDEVTLYAKWDLDPDYVHDDSTDVDSVNYDIYIYVVIGIATMAVFLLLTNNKKKYRRKRR